MNLNQSDIISMLVNISSLESEFHDGFHLLSIDWKLTHVSQYFSPKIINNIKIDRSKRIGGRYMAALFGSKIQGIMLCGIISKGFGLAIFRNGKEVLFEEIK